MSDETRVTSTLLMDRADPLGNSVDPTGRRALHALAQGGVLQIKGLSIAGRITQLSVSSAAWVAAPTTPLANRNSLLVQNLGNKSILWNYTNAVGVTYGVEIVAGGSREILVTDSIAVYLRATSGTQTVIIEELS